MLSGGQRQAIAIARSVHSGARILLLDEPLAAMGAKEGEMILDLIRDLKAKGHSMIVVAHNYVHVLEVCDRVNLLQHGRITLDRLSSETSAEELTELVAREYRRQRTGPQRAGRRARALICEAGSSRLRRPGRRRSDPRRRAVKRARCINIIVLFDGEPIADEADVARPGRLPDRGRRRLLRRRPVGEPARAPARAAAAAGARGRGRRLGSRDARAPRPPRPSRPPPRARALADRPGGRPGRDRPARRGHRRRRAASSPCSPATCSTSAVSSAAWFRRSTA